MDVIEPRKATVDFKPLEVSQVSNCKDRYHSTHLYLVIPGNVCDTIKIVSTICLHKTNFMGWIFMWIDTITSVYLPVILWTCDNDYYHFIAAFGGFRDTERMANTSINLAYFVGQTIIRLIVVWNRKKLTNFHQSVNSKILHLILQSQTLPQKQMYINWLSEIANSIRFTCYFVTGMTTLNFLFAFGSYTIAGYKNSVPLLQLFVLGVMVSDFSSIIVLYGSVTLWIICYIKCIILGLRIVQQECYNLSRDHSLFEISGTAKLFEWKKSNNMQKMSEEVSVNEEPHMRKLIRDYESLRELVSEMKKGYLSNLIVIWFASALAILLHQCFMTLVWIRMTQLYSIVGLATTQVFNFFIIFMLCDSGEQLTSQVCGLLSTYMIILLQFRDSEPGQGTPRNQTTDQLT
ncbi:unnamed protein product [Orchesella dallaii]|uniref:Gustatory receptor n=1 Tax=Orchesella dallaii TaxID=48710 RepID=A0ABP1QHK3_9HEXA